MESVIVYTGTDLRRMREDVGCGHWTASAIRVEAAEYLVCVRNRREQWAAMDFGPGTAFLIAKIKCTKPSIHAARIVVVFNTFAQLDIPDAWNLLAKGQRFPVAYLETSELLRQLRLEPDKLVWQNLEGSAEHPSGPSAAAPSPHLGPPAALDTGQSEAGVRQGESFAETVNNTRRALATSLGIPAQTIEITIRI